MPPRSVWERQREAVREEIARTAVAMFVDSGFETTTIDQVIERVGVSRRTFFRYFGTKEDLVLGDLVARGAVIAEALAARPPSEGPWDALRGALQAAEQTLSAGGAADVPSMLAYGRLLFGTPSLLARHLEKRVRWQELLAPLIADRLTGEDRDLRAHAIVASALACLDAASRAWVGSDGSGDLAELYDTALAAVRG